MTGLKTLAVRALTRALVFVLVFETLLPLGRVVPAQAVQPLPPPVAGATDTGWPADALPSVIAVDPNAPLVTVTHPEDARAAQDAVPGRPAPEATLPVSLTLSASSVQVAAGEHLTLTVAVENTADLPLRGELHAQLPYALALNDTGAWHYDPRTRILSATVTLPPHVRLTRRYHLRVAGVPEGDSLQATVALVQPGVGRSTASLALRVANPVLTGSIGPAGGTALRSPDDRLRLEFSPGAVTETVRVEARWQHLGELDAGGSTHGRFLALRLEAFDAVSGAPVTAFAAPVRVSLALGDLLPAGSHPTLYLQHYREDLREWQTVSGPLVVDSAGLLETEITHFSDYSLLDPSKQGWVLQFQDASVGTFTGAVSYAYPLELPPGRHGLAPDLTLAYSSARVGGPRSWVQSDFSGAGWNLDVMEITRGFGVGTAIGGQDYNDGLNHGYSHNCAHQDDLCFNDVFSLLYHGTSYTLIPDPTDSTAYHTQDASFLKIRRIACANQCPGASNQGGYHRGETYVYDYWEVTDQAGTVYRLGAREDSEQRHDKVCVGYSGYSQQAHWCGDPGYGDRVGTVVFRWRLDTATDIQGQQMGYYYTETSAANQGTAYGWAGRTAWDRESYLSYIGYNRRTDQAPDFWGYEVHLDLMCRSNAPAACWTAEIPWEPTTINDATATDYGSSAMALWFQRRVLRGVRVLQMTSATTGTVIREYRLAYGESGARDTGLNQLPSRVLASITPYGQGGYTGTQSVSLPATTFSYVPLPNQSTNGGLCSGPAFEYGRLGTVENGYGARISLTYNHPSSEGSCLSGLAYQHNWRVATKTVTDTATPAVAPALVTAYDYNWTCYADKTNPFTCHSVSDPAQGWHSLVGHGIVTETVRAGGTGGPVLSRTEQRFVPDLEDWTPSWTGTDLGERAWALVGREKRTRQLDAAGTVLGEVRNVFTSTVLLARTGNDENGKPLRDVEFVHQDETLATQYSAAGSLLHQTRSATAYELTYGRPVTQYHYGLTRLLSNGGFERGLTNWTAFNYTPGAQYAATTAAAAAALGNAGLKLTYGGGGPCDCGVEQGTGEQIELGRAYRVSARVRRAGTSGPTFLLMAYNGVNGTGAQYVYQVPTAEWSVVSLVYTATAFAQLYVRLQPYGSNGVGGDLYVDDVWYERLDETGDERTSTTTYVSPDVSHWVVALPSESRVYTGTTATGTAATRSVTAYTVQGLVSESRVYTDTVLGLSAVTRYGYDRWGNGTRVTDTRGYASVTAFDPFYATYPMTVTNAKNQMGYVRYDFGLARVTSATNLNTVTTSLAYDRFGRLVRVIEDGDNAAYPTLAYDYVDNYQAPGGTLRGLKVETVRREVAGSSASSAVQRQYDFYSGRGLLVQSRSELGSQASPQQAVTTPGYDAAGRVITGYVPYQAAASSGEYDPAQRGASGTRTQYDVLGRTVIVTGTDGTATRMAYQGRATAVLDANRHQKVTVVDAYGQLVEVREYTGTYTLPDLSATADATTTYAYTVLGSLMRVTDHAGNLTTMRYDAAGQKTGMTDPDMGSWAYTYDPAGNLLTQTDAQGARTCFGYDALSRLVWKQYNGTSTCPASATDAYGYDGGPYGIGQRTAMTNTSALVAWTYDRRGRVTAETRTVTGMGTYTYRMGYNSANQVVTSTYPTGETLQHSYTAAGQPLALASIWTTYVPEAQYNVRGGLDWFKQYTGALGYLQTSYSYYDTGNAPSYRLKQLDTSYTNAMGVPASRLRLDYGYDPVGNVQAITDTTNAGQVQSFGYDALDRLTSAATNGLGTGQYGDTYSYSALGNFLTLDGRAYVYDPAKPHAARYSYVLNGGDYSNFDSTGTPSGWTTSGAQNWAAGYAVGAERVVKHGGSTVASTFERSALALGAGDAMQVEFQVNQANADVTLRVSNSYNTQGFGLVALSGALSVLSHSGKSVTYQDCGWSLQAGVWYVMKLYVGDGTVSNKFTVTVWQRDDPGQRCYKEGYNAAWTGSWRYRSIANDHGGSTTLYQDNYFELQAGGSAFTYAYDANGNMTARLESGTAYAQTWDAQNRLVGVQSGTGATLGSPYTFAYDADGGRVLQTAPSGAKTAYAGAYEVTLTPTLSLLDGFPAGTNPPTGWSAQSGTWNAVGGVYSQTNPSTAETLSVRNSGASYQDLYAEVRVRLDPVANNTNALAGLTVRRNAATGAQYFVAVRNSASASGCGIFEKTSGGVWYNRASGGAACKVAAGTWHTLGVRVRGTRLELWLDGVFVTAYTLGSVTSGQFGVGTLPGAATFDDVTLNVLTTTNGDAFRSYYAFGAARVAVRNGTGAAAASAAPVLYLAADHLGSTTLALTTGGAVWGSRVYYTPWGNTRVAGTLPTDFTYTGGRDTGLGLVHLGARWYATYHNQWLSPDSIVPDFSNPQSLNRYSYVFNRPLKYNDPSGHCPWCVVVGVAALGGALVGAAVDLAVQVVPQVTDITSIGAIQVDLAEVGGAAVAGAVSGALAAGIGPVVAAAGTAVTAATGGAASTVGIVAGVTTSALAGTAVGAGSSVVGDVWGRSAQNSLVDLGVGNKRAHDVTDLGSYNGDLFWGGLGGGLGGVLGYTAKYFDDTANATRSFQNATVNSAQRDAANRIIPGLRSGLLSRNDFVGTGRYASVAFMFRHPEAYAGHYRVPDALLKKIMAMQGGAEWAGNAANIYFAANWGEAAGWP